MNMVIAGDYKGQGVLKTFSGVSITLPMFKTVKICKDTVKNYEILDKNTQISAFDAVRRANNWSFLTGNAGYAAALGGIRYAIQCKCYSSDLGNKPVQEVYAGIAIYKCQVGSVISNRYFTAGAKELAAATGIHLWDRDWIISLLEELDPDTLPLSTE